MLPHGIDVKSDQVLDNLVIVCGGVGCELDRLILPSIEYVIEAHAQVVAEEEIGGE